MPAFQQRCKMRLSQQQIENRQLASKYLQIQKQIESLQLQASKIRDREVAGVVARIKVAIDHYGLTADQLGLAQAGSGKSSPRAGQSKSPAAKYSDGTGNVWGGRGPRPKWLRESLASGRSLDEFSSAPRETAPASGAKQKRKAKVRFRDASGRTWSGMGPRPRWLKEALEAGRAEQIPA